MKLLREIPEAAMVAAFLRAEFSSPRFSAGLMKSLRALGLADAVITSPDLTDPEQNELRAQVLGAHRGYGQNREMFIDVPAGLIWHEAEITREEVGRLRYVDYSYWNELTGQTRLVRDAVRNICRGTMIFDVPNDRFWGLAEQIRRGEHDFEPMIVWGQDAGSPLEILEGHLRATALGLAGDQAPATTTVIVGLAPSREGPDEAPPHLLGNQ